MGLLLAIPSGLEVEIPKRAGLDRFVGTFYLFVSLIFLVRDLFFNGNIELPYFKEIR